MFHFGPTQEGVSRSSVEMRLKLQFLECVRLEQQRCLGGEMRLKQQPSPPPSSGQALSGARPAFI
jgi:hypothetical protein